MTATTSVTESSPQILVIAGPNGAGKSTSVAKYLPPGMVFVNADEIAKQLSEYPSTSAEIRAGRIALELMEDLERQGESFAVETTLASRTLAKRIARLRDSGYHFHLIFVWSPSADFSVQRVAARVRAGGHNIPEETIRRRYAAGIKNFFRMYRPIADIWELIENTGLDGPRAIATGTSGGEETILDNELWAVIQRGQIDEPE